MNKVIYIIILLFYFSPTSTKPQALNLVLSRVRLQRRLIGVKSVEEGDRISTLDGYYYHFFCYNYFALDRYYDP